MSIIDTNPRLKLHAEINRIARRHGVINNLGAALRNLYREVPEPTTEQKIIAKLMELRKFLENEELRPLIDQAAFLYRLPAQLR